MWREFIRIGEAVLRRERESKAGSPVQQTSSGTLTLSSMETPEEDRRAFDLRAARRGAPGGSEGRSQANEETAKSPANHRQPPIDDFATIDREAGIMTITGGTGQPVKIMLDSHLQSEDDEPMKTIVISVRVTKSEHQNIRKAARGEEQTLSFFSRECILRELKRAENPPMENVKDEITQGINRLLRQMSEGNESE